MSQSWVAVDKESGKAVFETYSRAVASKINTSKYNVMSALEYLQYVARTIKEANEDGELSQFHTKGE